MDVIFKLRFLLKLQQTKWINCNKKYITAVLKDSFLYYDMSALSKKPFPLQARGVQRVPGS